MKESRKQSPSLALRTICLFKSIEESLIQKFVGLDLSSMSFLDETVLRAYDAAESESFDHLEIIPEVFTSLGEVQKYGELSMRRIIDFMALTKSWKDDSQEHHSPISITAQHIHLGEEEYKAIEHIPELSRQQEINHGIGFNISASLPTNPLMQRALAWNAAFQPLFQHSRTQEGKKDFIRTTLLQIRLKTALIAASTSTLEGELQFDTLTHLYEDILNLAESISDSAALGSRKASFTFDIGPIGPLL